MAIRLKRKAVARKHRVSNSERHANLLAKRLRVLLLIGCVGGMATSTGCSLVGNACKVVKRSNRLDDCMIGYRNSVLAAKAWHNEKHCFENKRFLRDYKAGFMQGYADVASGSDGCVPAVAPQSYLGWKYQAPDGQARVNAWFAGYPMGVRAAEKDGVGNWGQVRPMGAQVAQSMSQPLPHYLQSDAQSDSPFVAEPTPLDDGPTLAPAAETGPTGAEPEPIPTPEAAGESIQEAIPNGTEAPAPSGNDSAELSPITPNAFDSTVVTPASTGPSFVLPFDDGAEISETISDQPNEPLSFEFSDEE